MDPGSLRTPSHLLPAAQFGSQTQRKPLLYPRPAGNLLPNTSPAPFRRKRTFKDYQDSAPAPPPSQSEVLPLTLHKILIQEELDRLQLVIDAGHVLDLALTQEEQHIELEDAALHPESSDPYTQSFSEFVVTSRKQLPTILYERLALARQTTPTLKIASGALPDIKRCWFGIGKTLYLWDYELNTPLFEYSDLPDLVITVAVVPKNRELFTHKVTNMLLISTPAEVLVFGVVFDPFFNLLPTGLSVPSNECHYTQFAAHPNGRIFMGGTEGKVVELTYDYQYFFSTAKRYKRCTCGPNLSTRMMSWFVNVEVAQLVCDPSRNLLYALITCSTTYSPFQIDVYDLGASGSLMSLSVSIDAFSFLDRLRSSSTTLLTVPPDRLALQHIFPVQRCVSLDYHLLVVLKNGIRVWISLMVESRDSAEIDDPGMAYRPNGEYAITVKLPPISIETVGNAYVSAALRPTTIGLTSDKPSNYDQMLFLDDASLVLLERTISETRLVVIRRSLSRIARLQTDSEEHLPDPCETVSCVEDFHQTLIQCMAAVPATNLMDMSEAELCGLLPRSAFALVPVVHWLNEEVFSVRCLPGVGNVGYMPPAQFQMVTDGEWIEFTEQRPVDVLFNILEEEGQRETDKLRSLCDQYGLVHVCSMLLSIALSPTRFLHRLSSTQAVLEPSSDPLRTKAQSLFSRLSTCKLERETVPGPIREQDVEEPMLAQIDHQALALYLSRVLRPVWGETVAYSDVDSRSLVEQFRKSHLDAVKSRLTPFTLFIETHYPDSLSDLQRVSFLKPADRVLPRNPVAQVYTLAVRSLQAIELLLQLSEDFAFRRMIMEMRPEEQNAMRGVTFKGLVASQQGHLMAKGMVEAYIKQLKTARSVKTKRMKLEEVLALFSDKCIGYFTPADAEIFLAEDAISRAKLEPDPAVRQDFLTAAIQRLMKNAASVSLRRVTDELLQAREIMPVISLCIKKAKDLSEIRGTAALEDMQDCYETIFLILEDVRQSLSVKSQLFVSYLSGLDLDSIARLENEILTECCKVTHKELHWALMQWLTRMNLLHKIVQLDSPYVLEFLSTEFAEENYPELSLLAEYAMKSKDYKRAYMEYGRLAMLRQDQALTRELIPLNTRSEYLDLSLVCLETYIKDCSDSEIDLKKLHEERISLELSQRLCKIQLRVQRDLTAKGEATGARDLGIEAENLDRMLLTVEELYEKIAKPRQLYEAQLELLHFHRESSSTSTPEATQLMKSLFIPIIETQRNSQWPSTVLDKLEELGKKYPYSFPLDLVITHCEAINIDLRVESPWVLDLILRLPLTCDFADLFKIYSEIWTGNDGEDLNTVWILAVRLSKLMLAWLSAAEKKAFPLPAFWENPHSSNCHTDTLFCALPAIFKTIDSVENRCGVLEETRKGRVSAEMRELRERFELLQERLNYKGQVKAQASPQQPDTKSIQRVPAKLMTFPHDRL